MVIWGRRMSRSLSGVGTRWIEVVGGDKAARCSVEDGGTGTREEVATGSCHLTARRSLP